MKIASFKSEGSMIYQAAWVANTLFVEFKDRKNKPTSIYRYDGVGFGLFEDFVNAESHGKFFNQFIKPLDYTKILSWPKEVA